MPEPLDPISVFQREEHAICLLFIEQYPALAHAMCYLFGVLRGRGMPREDACAFVLERVSLAQAKESLDA